MNQDYQEELLHLESCLSLIQENIRLYEAREQASRKRLQHYFRLSVRGGRFLRPVDRKSEHFGTSAKFPQKKPCGAGSAVFWPDRLRRI